MEKKTYVLRSYDWDGYMHVVLTKEEADFVRWFLTESGISNDYTLYDYDYFHNSIDEDDDIELSETIEYNKED